MAAAILITGANRGLGFEFASRYLAERWRVFAACRGLWFPTVICSVQKSNRDINQIIDVWLPLTLATNCTNRSMGPARSLFVVLSPRVIDKLGYIGNLIHAA